MVSKADQHSSDSPFQRFAKLAKAVIAVPKKEAEQKAVEWRAARARTHGGVRRIRRARFGAIVLVVLAGCAIPTATRVTRNWDWKNFTVVLTIDSYPDSCFLEEAVLTNTGTQSRSFVSTELIVATLSGATVRVVGIYFPPTVGGGTANAGVGSSVLAPSSCDNVQLQMTAH